MGAPTWRKGRLLVAAPNLMDPNFHRTVVLVLEHTDEGAVGVVLNRPTTLRADEALPPAIAAPLAVGDVIHEGGPVDPASVILLAEFVDGAAPDAGAISVRTVRVVEPDVDFSALGDQVVRLRAFGGYSGWSAGQLEDEIEQEAWIDCPTTSDDIFCGVPEALWHHVLDRQGGHLRLVARMPLDPSLN